LWKYKFQKQKVLRIFLFISHFFCCFLAFLCMNYTLKSQEMAIPDLENQNFPGGACPRTSLACAGLRAWLVKFPQLRHCFRYFMFGKYNGFVSKARVSACMYFLVISLNVFVRPELHTHLLFAKDDIQSWIRFCQNNLFQITQ
jgi:hypothetical protein